MKNIPESITVILFFLLMTLSCSNTEHPKVRIYTEAGDIEVELFPDRAPVTAGNFLDLVEKGAYTDAMFYRVVRMDNQPLNDVKIEVIQGGLLLDSLIDRYASIQHETTLETGIKHKNGTISMARNAPGSASTEFFICIGDQPSLDFGGNRNPDGQGFAAFGKVVKGMDVVRAIQAMPDTDQMLTEEVKIIGKEVVKQDECTWILVPCCPLPVCF